jgi:beta-galactosidase
VLEINPPRKASSITLQLAGWDPKPNSAPIWGIDNISIKVERSPEFLAKVKPMLNLGGMMEYPHGSGGIVLCNLLFKATEQVPVNMQKKRTILADLLRNLNAPFAAKTVIVGSHLDYTPIDISKQANQYRTDRGWFGDRSHTFTDLPTGTQNFAGVTYDIYDFPTSPVPTCIMLGGRNVPNNPPDAVKGIPVNRKADALFFLQTVRIDQPLSAQDVQQNKKYELFKYVIHYADGQTVEVPVIQGWSVGNYVEKDPQSLPGAALAWSAPFGRSVQSAAAWTLQWNNPRPDVEIASIDMLYGHDRRAVPVLLAVTAAKAR